MELISLANLIDRFSRTGVPKYIAFRDAFVYAITSGEIKPGEKIPGEKELAAVLPLSLGTIQKGLKVLADERVISRRTGQGSFVSPTSSDEMSAPFHCRFVNDAKNAYVPAYPRIVSRARVEVEGEWSKHLKATHLICIERVININKEFNVYTKFFADRQRLPIFETLSEKKLSAQNFKEVIFSVTGKTIGRMDLFVNLEQVAPAIGAWLEISKNATVMRFTALAFLGNTDPVYYQEIVVPKTERTLHISVDGTHPGLNL